MNLSYIFRQKYIFVKIKNKRTKPDTSQPSALHWEEEATKINSACNKLRYHGLTILRREKNCSSCFWQQTKATNEGNNRIHQ